LLPVFFVTELIRAVRIFGWEGLWLGALMALLAYATTLTHELGHCFAGEKFGGHADSIMLWPLGGLAMLDGVPQRPAPQILTALAGPAVNVVECVILGIILAAAGRTGEIWAAMPIFGHGLPWPESVGIAWFLVTYAFGFGLLNCLFNLIPAYPLDGGRVFVWALTTRMGYWHAAMKGTMVGMVFAIGMGVYGLIDRRPMFVLLAIFVWVMCKWERGRLQSAGPGIEGDVFGYDFSQGYTSLEGGGGQAPARPPRKPGPIRRWLDRRAARRRERAVTEELAVRRRVDELLQKINADGMNALSEREKSFLRDASKRFKS
jgi:Zn-dependent protease